MVKFNVRSISGAYPYHEDKTVMLKRFTNDESGQRKNTRTLGISGRPFRAAIIGPTESLPQSVAHLEWLPAEQLQAADAMIVTLVEGSGDGGLSALDARAAFPLLPVIDMTGVLVYADATPENATAGGIKAALDRVEPIIARSRDLPKLVGPDADALMVLATAYTRDRAVEAVLTPAHASAHVFPMVGHIARHRDILGRLEGGGLLKPVFFDRVHVCRHCDSSRVLAREVCGSCGSSHIDEMPLLHHYKCGHQAPRADFEKGDRLICPKCNTALRHYSVDYDISGTVVVCSSCGAVDSEAEVGFVCMDCGQGTAAKDAALRVINHFELTADGITAVLAGALPSAITGRDDQARLISAEEFDRMVSLERKRAQRHNRPHAVVRVMLQIDQARIAELGLAQLNATYFRAAEMIAEQLRESDVLSAQGPVVYMLMPETPTAHAPLVAGKIEAALSRIFGITGRYSLLSEGDQRNLGVESAWEDLTLDRAA